MSDRSSFRDRYGPWALVTGASSGIGDQFARQLAAAGLDVMLVARRADRLQALAGALESGHGVQAAVLGEDLADREALGRVAAAAAARDVGLVVSNAGFGLKGAHEQLDLHALERMLDLNARAPLVLLHQLLPGLVRRGRGGVILTGSVEGEAPFPWSSAYAATKAFVRSLGLGIAGELAGTGVDLLVLEPGATDTEALPLQGFSAAAMPGLMQPAEVVREALGQLGRGMLLVPGEGNRAHIDALRRLAPEQAVEANAAAMSAALEYSGRSVKR